MNRLAFRRRLRRELRGLELGYSVSDFDAYSARLRREIIAEFEALRLRPAVAASRRELRIDLNQAPSEMETRWSGKS
ncbi:hypothetical protein [Sphingomonas sanguinis]|uniref:hypothetical protein n=1 Tax=Sphingomonas sanguinis TaxID=33051 RepID=UPI00077B8FB8|nr:hypothetical protein [Sphingomonas sanguinis]